MKENIEFKKNFFQPKICKKSENMINKNRNKEISAHDRLYKLSRKIKDNKKKNPEADSSYLFGNSETKIEEPTFQPKINERSKNIERKKRIEDRLLGYIKTESSGITISSVNSSSNIFLSTILKIDFNNFNLILILIFRKLIICNYFFHFFNFFYFFIIIF